MLKKIETNNLVGVGAPNVYIKSIKHNYNTETNKLYLKIFYYVIDYSVISWIDKANITDRLKICFDFKYNTNLINKKISFAPILRNIVNGNLENVPKILLNDAEYYVFHDNFEIELEKVILKNNEFSVNMSYYSELNKELKAEQKNLLIQNNNTTNYFEYNNSIFIDKCLKIGNKFYSKYDLNKEINLKETINLLYKDYRVFNVNNFQLNNGQREDEKYFEFFKLTQTGYGNTKGIFVFNFEKFIMNNLFFCKYYNLRPVLNELLKSIKYSISIYRNRIDDIKHEEQDKNRSNKKLVAEYLYDNKTNGNISEILGLKNYFNNANRQIYKTFIFNDKNFKNEIPGDYYYTIDFKVIDTSLKIYRDSFLSNIENIIKTLESYKYDVKQNTVGTTGFVKQTFYNTFLNKYSTGQYSLLNCIEILSNIYNLLYKDRELFKNFCIAALHPSSCNLEDIETLILFINNRIYATLNGIPNIDGTPNEEIFYSKEFREEYVEKFSNEVGQDFISVLPSQTIESFEKNSSGLSIYSIRQVEDRLQREYIKYTNTNVSSLLYLTLNTLSPAQVYINNNSYGTFDRNLKPIDYDNFVYSIYGNYKGIDKNFTKYQNQFYQLMDDGLYLKNITAKSRIRKDPNSSDILFDNSVETGNYSLQYIVNTGLYDFYNSIRTMQLKSFFEEYKNNPHITGTFQYKQSKNDDGNSRIVFNDINNNNYSTLLFNNFDIVKIKIQNIDNVVDIDNVRTAFSSSNNIYKYTLCKVERISTSPVFKNSKIYNEYFLVDNGTVLQNLNNTGSGYFQEITTTEELNNFNSLFVEPEFTVNYIESSNQNNVPTPDYYLKETQKAKRQKVLNNI